MIILINKPLGKTPLEVLDELKTKDPNKYKKLSYAGRLDPMASGLMIVLVNETCRNQPSFLNLPKVYKFKICWGFQTDSYDILGLVNKYNINIDKTKIKLLISEIKKKFTGSFNQKFPPYSSKTVGGKPLWYYAKNNLLDTITLPEKTVTINRISHIESSLIDSDIFIDECIKKINTLHKKHYFRQEQIINKWSEIKDKVSNKKIMVSEFLAEVSSGTYIRMLVNDIGDFINEPCLTCDINRISVGNYTL